MTQPIVHELIKLRAELQQAGSSQDDIEGSAEFFLYQRDFPEDVANTLSRLGDEALKSLVAEGGTQDEVSPKRNRGIILPLVSDKTKEDFRSFLRSVSSRKEALAPWVGKLSPYETISLARKFIFVFEDRKLTETELANLIFLAGAMPAYLAPRHAKLRIAALETLRPFLVKMAVNKSLSAENRYLAVRAILWHTLALGKIHDLKNHRADVQYVSNRLWLKKYEFGVAEQWERFRIMGVATRQALRRHEEKYINSELSHGKAYVEKDDRLNQLLYEHAFLSSFVAPGTIPPLSWLEGAKIIVSEYPDPETRSAARYQGAAEVLRLYDTYQQRAEKEVSDL